MVNSNYTFYSHLLAQMFGPDTREPDNAKPRGIQLPSLRTTENSGPVGDRMLTGPSKKVSKGTS